MLDLGKKYTDLLRGMRLIPRNPIGRASGDIGLTSRMSALTSDLKCVFVLFTIGAAELLRCCARTGRMSAFLLVGHSLSLS
jgi:hypothetical protein